MRTTVVGILIAMTASAVWASDPEHERYIARMEQEHSADQPEASPAASKEPRTEVVSTEAVYADLDGKPITGFLAHPASGVPEAGILVIHEWWGLNDNIRSVTRQLAGEGYIALAVDLYEGKVAEDRESAARLARGTGEHPQRLLENLRQAIDDLRHEGVERIGVIGWCFGGGWSLQTALAFAEEIEAAVIYYGRLTSDRQQLAALSAPLLGIFGALDEGIPVLAVRDFQASLEALGKVSEIHIYEGADHAFANPSGGRYNQAAAEDAWAKTVVFLARHLR